MKIRLYLAIISVLLTALLVYAFCIGTEKAFASVVAGVVFIASLFPAMALYFEGKARMTVMFRLSCWIMFVAFLVLNVLLSIFNANNNIIAIFNGFGLIIEALSLYGIYRAAMNR